MNIFKIKTKTGWLSLYQAFMNKCVIKDNNLGDIVDKNEARINLELTGDVETHNHDTRYISKIQAVEDNLSDKIDKLDEKVQEDIAVALGDILKTVDGDINLFNSVENGWYLWNGTIDSVTGSWIIRKMTNLYTASNREDPRIVLSSNNLETWYSPYAYWHS